MKSLQIIIFIVLFSCKTKDVNYCSERIDLVEATMLSLDSRECACCGGYFIRIEEDTFRFSYVDATSLYGISSNANDYPRKVRIEWEIDSSLICMGDEIRVTDYCHL